MGTMHLLLQLLSSLSLLLLLPTIAAQPGFISIDCGASRNYTDDIGLNWSTDDGFIGFGVNAAVSSTQQQQMSTARHFKRRVSKACYILPATSNTSYLIRASFLRGDLTPQVPPGYTFGLSIDSTVVGNVSITPSSASQQITREFFAASMVGSQEIAFCLLRGVGDPFISSLELRPLNESMYFSYMFSSQYGVLHTRWNCGTSSTDPVIRYKDDAYDRIWANPDNSVLYPSLTSTLALQPGEFPDSPPMSVMQTAWETPSTAENITISLPFDAGAKFYAGLFFQELAPRRSPTDFRSIDFKLELVSGSSYLVYTNLTIDSFSTYLADSMHTIDESTATFTVSANNMSTLPPILNAFEFHAIYPTSDVTTGYADVAALEVLKQSLGLTSWTGDPCVPVPWEWVNCSSSTPIEVTRLMLSGYQLHGTLPASLATMTALTDIWLDNNFITGTIPDLSSLTKLSTLHLQNNSMIGAIPPFLADLPSLTQLLLEFNNFTGPLPPGLLDREGLILQVDSSVTSANPPLAPKKHHKSNNSGEIGAIIGAVVGVLAVLSLIACVAACCCFRTRRNQKRQSVAPRNENSTSVHADLLKTFKPFSMAELAKVTDDFSKMIGRGAYGPVFHGYLDNGVEVAVKKNSVKGQGQEEFHTEVSLLSRVHHRNLLALIGFCDEKDERVLIYEYMNGGTLYDGLHPRDMADLIDWEARVAIALDAARGLEYLHYDCKPRIIHRDVKSRNILLNDRLQAKVADFGISKTTDEDTATGFSDTRVIGTPGYLDPEYHVTNRLTYKSDVYSFGVVLLEIISGEAAFMRNTSLTSFARQRLMESNLEAIADPALDGNYNVEAMWKLAELAMACVEPASINRPDMRDVVKELAEVKKYVGKQNSPTRPSSKAPHSSSDSEDQSDGPLTPSTFTTSSNQDDAFRTSDPGSLDPNRTGPWQALRPR